MYPQEFIDVHFDVSGSRKITVCCHIMRVIKSDL